MPVPVNDRRKNQRKVVENTGSTFIELQHTFGPVSKSVYRVGECDEHGLSFFIPITDGYFSPGTPIKFSLVYADSMRANGFGIIRYYQPYNDGVGNSFFKIGVELNGFHKNTIANNLILRPERYRLKGRGIQQNISFVYNEQRFAFELTDVSRYSAAFVCSDDDVSMLRMSSTLADAQIMVGGKIIYSGSLTVMQIFSEGQLKKRVVVGPRGKLIEVEYVEKFRNISAAVADATAIIEQGEAYTKISPQFRAAVADLRCLLEDYKRLLESPRFQNNDNRTDELLEEILPVFAPTVDSLIRGIDRIVRSEKQTTDDLSAYKAYYQKHLLPLLLTAPVCHRSYYKPEGYPGDYGIMRMMHENRFDGPTSFARLLHKYNVTCQPGEVVRKRTQYLAERIKGAIEKSDKQIVNVFSIASGPALEIERLMEDYPHIASRISLTLLDQEINALRFSLDNLYEKRIKHDIDMKIDFIHQSLNDYLREYAGQKEPKRYDIIYSFGLFDYFDADIARWMVKCIIAHLNPGATFILSNASLENNDYRTYMEFGLEWYLIYRDRKQLQELAEKAAKGMTYSIGEIEDGFMKFLEIST